MNRKDYQLYKWYPITDETYWVDDNNEFPNCQTIVTDTRNTFNGHYQILTQSQAYLGWGTMAKYGEWKFMIVEKPTIAIHGEITKEELNDLEYFHINETSS